jgi:hypothetical protein
MSVASESLYHVTALSNFARGFDKYTRQYRKSWIPESTYPNESYLLCAGELGVGIAKASKLREKVGIPGDELLVLQAAVSSSSVRPNLRNGVGLVWASPDLPISKVFRVSPDGRLGSEFSVEEAMAKSIHLNAASFIPYVDIRPRTLSFLPIARGCQAACPFCFSEASVSTDQPQMSIDPESARRWIELAAYRGAERAVITGGGEPTLLPWENMLDLVAACSSRFETTVLITNGVRLAGSARSQIGVQLQELSSAGLTVLAVSRHHHSEAVNAGLMRLETRTPTLLEAHASLRETLPKLRFRLICVLQRGGVESVEDIGAYLAWATSFGVEEVCFKELYVATSEESVYFTRKANAWSAANQVPLSVVHEWAELNQMTILQRLPWGAPIFGGTVSGRPVRIAAYTEPSLFWERLHGLARSWNVMSDGTCLASLEDRRSVINASTMIPRH